jgi:uncharacterized membrane protein YdcZ (DUF606 family)
MFAIFGILLLLAWILNNALGLDPRVPQWALWVFAGGCLGFDLIRSQIRAAVPKAIVATTERTRRNKYWAF